MAAPRLPHIMRYHNRSTGSQCVHRSFKMSVPVVPSKSTDRAAFDADTELAWPPPDDSRLAVDVLDLQTRRVMTVQEAAIELDHLAAPDDVVQTAEPLRPFTVVESSPVSPARPEPSVSLDEPASP